ncbi:MAG: Cna B-type domain-containing protein [Clostridia bacterium]|nr:Cna B-type domain-containing protein [Clostridia bacterium]
MKRLTSLLIALLMCLTMIPSGALAVGEKDTGSPAQQAEIAGNEPLEAVFPTESAKAGHYIMTFTPLGENFAEYYDMTACVMDADGNTIGLYTMGSYGLDPWEPKVVDAFLNSDPVSIRINCMYKLNGEDYCELVYEGGFEETCFDKLATAVNINGLEIDFCRYSIECVSHNDGSLPGVAYIDAEGGMLYRDKCFVLDEAFTNELSDNNENEGWYCLRGVHVGDHAFEGSFYVNGNVDLVLCDGATFECRSVIIEDGASLTIWQQRGGSGSLIATSEKVTGVGVDDFYYAAIDVPEGCSLTINGGRIDATGGDRAAGIGSSKRANSGSITINNGVVYAAGGMFAAAIGGGDEHSSGTITINGGYVEATGGESDNSSSYKGAAAIGGGGNGANGPIVINGGSVSAFLGLRSGGAAIGCGETELTGGPITINGGSVNTDAPIGSGGSKGMSGAITITGGHVIADSYSTAIGGLRNGPITITGGVVEAYSKYFRAAIGATDDQIGAITISGGTVIARCSAIDADYRGLGAGIGGGGGSSAGCGGEITISGKDTNVIAISEDGAGIGSGGCGRDLDGILTGTGALTAGNITINDGFVFALSTQSGAGIGGGNGGNGGSVTINGGYVIAYGGSGSFNWYTDGGEAVGDGSISGGADDIMHEYVEEWLYGAIADAIIDLIFSRDYSGAGIGGGSDGSGGTVRINGGVVIARGGTNECSAIGWGMNASGVDLEIYDGAKVTYGSWQDDEVALSGVTDGADQEQKARDFSYAKIQPGDVTVSFDVGEHGLAPEPQTISMGQTAEQPEDPYAEGFYFGGWYTDDSYNEPFDFEAPVMSDTVVYGRWLRAFEITISKVWPEGAELPASVTVDYVNEYSEFGSASGSLVLSAENGWSGTISLSEKSVLRLTEQVPEGFAPVGWALENVSEAPKQIPADDPAEAVLDLRHGEALGLTEEETASLLGGEGVIKLTNVRTRVYSAEIEWDIPMPNYKPAEVTVVLQHRAGGAWETVETRVLNENNEWQADFSPIPETEGMDANYRVRELDKNGALVLAAADDGGSENPAAVYHIEPWSDVGMDMTYEVSYRAEAGGRTLITNSAGRYYGVRIVWEADEDRIPEEVTAALYRNGAAASALTLNDGNHWEGVFEGQMDEAVYKVRERNSDGSTVYMTGDDRPAYYDENDPFDTAFFTVTKDGITSTYQFEVSIEVDEENRVTTLTNTLYGVIFSVVKEWNVPEGSLWPDRVYSVRAVLQKRVVEDGNAAWQDVETIRLASDQRWEGEFAAVPLGDGISEEDYRVREWIRRDEYGAWTDTMIDPGADDPEAEGRLMLTLEDEDNLTHQAPHFHCQNRYYSADGYVYTDAGFTVSYERGADGRFVIHNTLDGVISVKKSWVDNEGRPFDGQKPESVSVVLQKKNGDAWETVGEPAELNEGNGWRYAFDLTEELDLDDLATELADYRVRELDADGNVIYAAEDEDRPAGAENCVILGGAAFTVSYSVGGSGSVHTVTNRAASIITIEKKWDIDLEKKDRPESIEVVVQKKAALGWDTVKLIELSADKDWKATVALADFSEDEYRVRELCEETLLVELGHQIRELMGQGGEYYDDLLNLLTTVGKPFFDKLPEKLRVAAYEGYSALIKALNSTPLNFYNDLMQALNLASSGARVVGDKSDQDLIGTPNFVTYHVAEYESVLYGEKQEAHITKYKVSYKHEGGAYTITNKAMLEIDAVKRWFGIGVDDEDMPDSAWLILLCKPKEGALDNAQGIPGVGDLSGIIDYEFPVFDAEKGKDALSLLSELTIGVDLSLVDKLCRALFGVKIPRFAIGKAKKDKDWKVEFIVDKYTMGVPLEYKGAELSSEIIRQILKYCTGIDIPVSYNPFDDYFSIPTKAIRSINGITNPSDLLDLSKLTGAALAKAQTLTMDDLQNFGWDTLLDDYHLMANVINVKIDWESENETTLSGKKIWADDEEETRPETLIIRIKNGDTEIAGSPITLNKSDFEGLNEWVWSLELPEDADPNAVYVVSEEYPEGYEYKDDYTCETDGLIITNTWHKDTFTVSGQKLWRDDNDRFGYRPESITVRLYADGEEAGFASTTKEGEWKYCFPGLPKFAEDGHTIEYTLTEDAVERYTAKVDGFNVINEFALVPPTIEASRAELRARPESDSRKDLRFINTVHFNDSYIDYRGNTYGPNEEAYKIDRIWTVLSAQGRSVTVEGRNIFAMYADADGNPEDNCFTFTAVLVGMRPENFDAEVTAVPYLTYSLNGVSATVNGNSITESVNGALDAD